MHTVRIAGTLVRTGRTEVALMFGQAHDGREVIRAAQFDVDRAAWADWSPQVQQTGPCARWCHASCVSLDATQLFVFGGANWLRNSYRDAWSLRISDRSWRRLPLADVLDPHRGPVARQCASVVAVDARHVLLMGGVTRWRRMSRMLNDWWLVDLCADSAASVEQVWSPRVVSGDFVVPRESHSMVFDRARDQVVLFGGSTLLVALHPEWDQFVKCSGDNGDHLLNDVVIVNLATWSARVIDADVAAVPPRQGHACAIVGDCMIVCGGETTLGRERTNAVHVFDLLNERWILDVVVGGSVPAPWSFAASCQFDDSILLTNGFSDDEQSVYRLAPAAPASLFELCSMHVALACARDPLETFARTHHGLHAWSARVKHIYSTRAMALGRRATTAEMYFSEMRALFADIVDYLDRDVDPDRPDVMQLWRASDRPSRLASLLSLNPNEYDNEHELVAAFRGCARFALEHYESLFASPDDDDDVNNSLDERTGLWHTNVEMSSKLEWRVQFL
jgi:hypothetical protein